jgi:hypothetical protein
MSRVTPLARLAMLALLPFAAAVSAADPVPSAPRSATWDESRLQAGELEGLLVASMRAAAAQLAGVSVQAELADLRAVPDSLAGLALDGVGRVRVGEGEWIPVRVTAGYDVARAELSALRLRPIASGEVSRGGIEATALELVNAQVAAQLGLEFPDQARDITLVDLASTTDGAAHVAYRGAGWVEFGGEGQAPLRFSAILDRRSGRLVAFDYALDVLEAHGEPRSETLVAAH